MRADLQAIEEALVRAHNTEDEHLFQSRLRNAAELYDTLGRAMRRYQTVITVDLPIFRALGLN